MRRRLFLALALVLALATPVWAGQNVLAVMRCF